MAFREAPKAQDFTSYSASKLHRVIFEEYPLPAWGERYFMLRSKIAGIKFTVDRKVGYLQRM